jgi:hypothetical protein
MYAYVRICDLMHDWKGRCHDDLYEPSVLLAVVRRADRLQFAIGK